MTVDGNDRDPDAFVTRREAQALAHSNADLIVRLRSRLLLFGIPLVLGLLLLFGLTWADNKASCQRAAPLRSALSRSAAYFDGQAARVAARAPVEHNAARARLDLASARAARTLSRQLAGGRLDCGGLIP